MTRMSRTVTFTSSTLLATLAISSAACATDAPAPAPGDFTSGPEGEVAPAGANPARVVAETVTPEGARVIFFDESQGGGEPEIGVQILSDTTTPATDRVLAQAPSALELFLAIAPAAAAPRELVRDHELTSFAAGRDAAPRRLAVASATGEVIEPYDCADVATWAADFGGWAPVLDGQHIDSGWLTGTSSGYVGYSPTFYFDVCRPADIVAGPDPYSTEVQRRASSTGTWTTINTGTDTVPYQFRRFRYYRSSFTCSSYQHRLLVNSTDERHRRAARWADEWSCQVGS